MSGGLPPPPGAGGEQSPAGSREDMLSAQALRDATVSGVRWVMITRVAAELAGLAASIVLARLIAPAEFGRAVIVLVLPMLAVILTFEGLGSPLVQRRSLVEGDLETAMLLSLGAGIGLTVATFALAPMAAPLFGPETTALAQLVSPVFALAGAGTVSRAQLQRRLDFRRIGGYEVTAFAAGLATSLVLAFAGLEARALVLGPLVAVAVETVLMLRAAPPPRPRLRSDRAREILEFGLPATLAGLTYIARRNVDYVVLGARVGPTEVGIYWRAFQLGAEYQGKLSGIMLRVVFPVFSRAPSLQDMQELRARVVRLNTAVVFPLLAFLGVIAPVLVPWVYGPQWSAAVVPVQLLAVSGALLAVQSGSEPLALALGRPKAVLAFNVTVLSVYGPAVYVAAPYGLTTVCIVVVAVHVVMVAASQHLLLGRVAAMPLRKLWREISPAIVASGVLLAVTVPLATGLEPALGPLPRMLALGAAGGLAYVATLRALFPAAYAELRRVARRLLGVGRREVAATVPASEPPPAPAPDGSRGQRHVYSAELLSPRSPAIPTTIMAEGDPVRPSGSALMNEIASLLQRFWHLRRIMLLAVLVGVVAAVLSLFRITDESPYLESRSMARGVANIKVLVDAERSVLANADSSVETLAARSQVFVQLVDAADVRWLIAREAGIDPARLAVVTFDQRAGAAPARNPTLGQRSDEIADEVLGYRLEVAAQERVPIINMSAQAPDAAAAARLANAAARAVVQYISARTAGTPKPALDRERAASATTDGQRIELGRIRLEPLGQARVREISIGGGYGRGVIAGGLGFVLAAVVILFIAGLRDEFRARRVAQPGASRTDAPSG